MKKGKNTNYQLLSFMNHDPTNNQSGPVDFSFDSCANEHFRVLISASRNFSADFRQTKIWRLIHVLATADHHHHHHHIVRLLQLDNRCITTVKR